MENRPIRTFDFELPVGYIDEFGRLYRTATLRKMTGHEEALLADKKLRQNGGRLVTELLTNCLVKLGEIQRVGREIVAQLTSPDRNYLLLELRKITFGQEIEARYPCPACSETTSILEDLDTLPVRRLNGDISTEILVELEDGYEDKGGEIYTNMVFRLPNGVDEEKIASVAKENASRGTNALLTRCLVSVGEMPQNRREGLGTKLISDLTMGDRARIEKMFRQKMPGADLQHEVQCESCGRTFQVAMDLTSFFSVR